jgi:hypothetical protein
MAINLQQFKSKMDQYGGPARTNLFVVELQAANSNFMPTSDLRFFCKTVTLPSVTLETFDHKPSGIGMMQSMPIGITNDPVECIFMLDSQHRIISFFHEWMQNILNYDMSNGALSANLRDPTHMPYEINYKKGNSGYSMRMTITMFSNSLANSVYTCVLDDVFPKQVGSVNLSWEENDTPATLPISFSYSHMKMSGTQPSTATNNAANGLGQLQYITSQNNIGQTITQATNNIGVIGQSTLDSLTNTQPFSLTSNMIRT